MTFWLICFMQSALPRKLYLLDTGREIHISVLYQAFTLTILYILSSSATSRFADSVQNCNKHCYFETSLFDNMDHKHLSTDYSSKRSFDHYRWKGAISNINYQLLLLLSIFANKCLYKCIHISNYHSSNIELVMKDTDQSLQEFTPDGHNSIAGSVES